MASPQQDEQRRIYEHFVVAGLDVNNYENLSPSVQECGCRNTQPSAPITDICVIFPSLGETIPEGFQIVETTSLGYPADLNHGSLRMPSVFLGYRRGYHKPPLIDIGILDQGKGEKPMVDSHTVQTTPFGRPANVNNASQNLFLTYRRAAAGSSPSQFVVTDICIIFTNKGEIPPHTFYKIPKNLNKGMVGSDVYICYKKSQGTSKRLAYKPTVLDYFPNGEADEFRLAQNIPMFCLPMGALIECWPVNSQPPEKSFTTFVLTDENGTKFYGAAVSFYEKHDKPLTDEQLERLDLQPSDCKLEGGVVEDSGSNNDPADQMEFHTNLAICLISRFPFFYSFKRFLYYIHRMSMDGGIHSVPIERYLSHLKYEVCFPTPRRPRVMMHLGAESISFDSHDESQLPLSGAQLYDSLKSLGSDNFMYLMLLALLEQKILVHSLRSWMLTAVSESICALMFPFHWQCPYVPQCPLGLAGVLHAPLPFIAGVDSRYFELYEDPPEDVTCFDLDTSTISWSTLRHSLKLSMLPKKAAKQLKNSLEDIYRKIFKQNFETSQKTKDFVPADVELQIQRSRKELETEIHDAFLRFMAHLMKGYQSYLRPITRAPSAASETDTGNLFDLDGFLRSRDKSGTEFFKRFCSTQSFMRFIEERSFISDKNTYNAFFDDCMEKVISSDLRGEMVSLLDTDCSLSEKHLSVFIAPPEPILDCNGKEREFKYCGFPRKLNPELFQIDQLNLHYDHKVPVQHEITRCSAVRTKPEVKSSHLATVNAVRTNILYWPKILLFYSYSLWFMQLPSLISLAPNKSKILMLAFYVLDRMEQSGIHPLDQVCYRILIELCGNCDAPALAVRVLESMKRANVEQNAVTYGIYHRAVMNATWPTEMRRTSSCLWRKLRVVLKATSQFRRGFAFPVRSLAADSISHNSDFASQPFVISVHPLPEDDTNGLPVADPLGVLSSSSEPSSKACQATMSPSRAKFLAEHSAMPFSNDITPKNESKPSSKGSSWFKGFTSSPIIKMIRSQTFESPKPVDSNGEISAGMVVSPSFHSLVEQVRKQYDSVEGVSSKLKQGMSTLVHEVKILNKSYGPMGSGSLFGDESENVASDNIDETDPAYQLDSGHSGQLLSEAWWLQEVLLQMKRTDERERKEMESVETKPEAELSQQEKTETEAKSAQQEESNVLEVTISTATPCPNCRNIVYDEEIMAGWKVDDQNMNTICPHCEHNNEKIETTFAPLLTVKMLWRSSPRGSWYPPGGLSNESPGGSPASKSSQNGGMLSFAFISPLVLRRELENIVSTNIHSLKDKNLMNENAEIFWNLIYYLRRLGLPSHMYSWIAPRYHIRCIYDRPEQHQVSLPLYLTNPKNEVLLSSDPMQGRTEKIWNTVVENIQEAQLFNAMQTMINDSRRVTDSGQVALGNHFPLFRDIQFASVDAFGRALMRDNLDNMYMTEWKKLPVRIHQVVPKHDEPPLPLQRACRKIFLPLDLF